MKTKPLAFALLLALLPASAAHAADPTPPAASDAITDAEIGGVLGQVTRRQIQPLEDGDYTPVDSIAKAAAAKAPQGIAWDYPWGVTLFGMERFADLTGSNDADAFVAQHNLICARYYAWLQGLQKQFGSNAETFVRGTKLKELFVLGKLDYCGAMGNQMIEGFMRYPDQVTPEEKAVLARCAFWVVHGQERLPDGTLWRANQLGGTVWPDDLYMGGVFLVRYGLYTGDHKYLEDAANQIIHQAALEQDEDGLWFHGYFVKQKKHAPFKWGRGNGWVMVAVVETLSALPANDPLRPKLLEILRKQIDGLKPLQAPDGMWRQVLDHPELWEETSCTAMFAYGIARAAHRGWIDPANLTVARRAFAGVAQHVTADGAVLGTCEGTGIGTSLDFYIKRKQPVDDLHGRGPVILAGTELLTAVKPAK